LKIDLGSGIERLDSDLETEFFEPVNELLLDDVLLALIKIITAQIKVSGTALDEVVGNS
jgi:hypothetical protein